MIFYSIKKISYQNITQDILLHNKISYQNITQDILLQNRILHQLNSQNHMHCTFTQNSKIISTIFSEKYKVEFTCRHAVYIEFHI